MSLGRANTYEYLSPQEYQVNQALIKQAKVYIQTLEDMNESGRKKFQEREAQLEQARKELKRMVEEGEQARRLLEQLESHQSSGSTSQDIVPFSSARIEEVATNDHGPNQHASSSKSTSPPVNGGLQSGLQPEPPTQFAGNLAGQQLPPYHRYPYPPRYRPSPTEQSQQPRESLPSQNTFHPAISFQPYGSALVPPAIYGYTQQTTSEMQTSSTKPLYLPNSTKPVQQHEGQMNNTPPNTAASTSASTPGSVSGQANNRKGSNGLFSSNTMSALDQPGHALPKPADPACTSRNPVAPATTKRGSETLSQIIDFFAHKFSESDIRRDHENVRKWAEKALPGSSTRFPQMTLSNDPQGRVWLQFGDRRVEANHFFNALLLRHKETAAKNNPALPSETSAPMQRIQPSTQLPPGNTRKPNPPMAAVSPTSETVLPFHPPGASTTPAPAKLPQPSQVTTPTAVPAPAIPPQSSQITSNPVALPSPSQANKKRLAQDILYALGKRKQRPSASDLTQQPSKKRVPQSGTPSTSGLMKSAVNGTPSSTTHGRPSTVAATPTTGASWRVAPQTARQELSDTSLPSISTGRLPQARPVPISGAQTAYTPYGEICWRAVPQTAKPSASAVLSSNQFRGGSSLAQTKSATITVLGTGNSSSSDPSKPAPLPLIQPITGFLASSSSGPKAAPVPLPQPIADPSVSGPSKIAPASQTRTPAPATSGSTSSSMSHPSPPSLTSSGSGNSSTCPLSGPSPLAQITAAPLAISGSGKLPQSTFSFQTAPMASTSTVDARGINYSRPPLSTSSSDTKPPQPSASLASPARKAPPKVQREPLFLPSSVSPEPEPFQVSNFQEMGASEASSSTAILEPAAGLNRQEEKRKNYAYVLLPLPPEYLVRDRRRGEGQSGLRSRESVTSGSNSVLDKPRKDWTRTSSLSTSLVGEEDYDKIQSRRDRSIDQDELNAVLLSCSRLQALPCRWDGCDVTMNSVDSLIRHLNQHKPKASSNNPYFTCRWTQCGRRCTFKEKHLEKHATLPLRCAYADCEETFRTAGQLVKHFQAEHTYDALKPAAGILAPQLETPPPTPKTVPSYMLVTRAVLPQNIPLERHKLLIPWVVRNIVSSDHEVRAAKRVRKTARPINRDALAAGGPSTTDYEFLKTRSTRYSTWLSQPVDIKLDDLDSAEVSRMIDEGLMLWGPAEVGISASEERGSTGINDVEAPQSPLTPTRLSERSAEITTKMGEAVEAQVPREISDAHPHHDNGQSDEDIVEDMLRSTPAE